MRTGKTAGELIGGTTNWIERYRRDPARAAIFNAAMTALSNAHFTGVVDAYDFRSIHTLVDVGGGHGRLISMILSAYPKMRGVLFDMPDALSYPLLSDLNMMIRTGGCERKEGEYRALYGAAGFKLTRAIETPSPTGMTIIEGKPV